jgi:hypothetical protein
LVTRYRYELRRGDETVATGHLALPDPVEIGDRLSIGGTDGIVRPSRRCLENGNCA